MKIVVAESGSITEKALAVGQIQPRQKFSVKSKISGIVKSCRVEVGETREGRRPALRDPARPDAARGDRGRPAGRVGDGVVRARQGRVRPGEGAEPAGDHGPVRRRREARGVRAREDRRRQGRPGPRADPEGEDHVDRLRDRLDHPGARRRDDPDPRRQPGRPGRPAHVVPARDRAGDDRRHERPDLQGDGRRDRRRQAPRRAARRGSRSAPCRPTSSPGRSRGSRRRRSRRTARRSSTSRSSSTRARRSSCAPATRPTPT